jgi:hypothetical protein
VSAGAAAIPVPGLDLGTDVALLVEMLPAINSKFGLTPQQIEQMDSRSKRLVIVAVSSIGSEAIGKFISRTLVMSMLKKMGTKGGNQVCGALRPVCRAGGGGGHQFWGHEDGR